MGGPTGSSVRGQRAAEMGSAGGQHRNRMTRDSPADMCSLQQEFYCFCFNPVSIVGAETAPSL
jgi:hypothetical protein